MIRKILFPIFFLFPALLMAGPGTVHVEKLIREFSVKKNNALVPRIAEVYFNREDWANAVKWYKITLDYFPVEDLYWDRYAVSLFKANRYTLASKVFKTLEQTDKDLIKMKEIADSMAFLEQHPLSIAIKNSSLNSKASEFYPVSYKSGLLFTTNRDKDGKSGDNFKVCYTSDLMKGGFSLLNIKGLPEDVVHVGPCSISADGLKMILTVSRTIKTRSRVQEDPTAWDKLDDAGTSHLEMYELKLKDNAWVVEKPFSYNNIKAHSVGYGTFDKSGTVLYFSSDMAGGFGSLDLYCAKIGADGKWTTPVNLGPTVNTKGTESFPVMMDQGTLYFSSTGHPGFGGFDLFFTKGSEDKWGKVRNVGLPLNSEGDEIGICFDAKLEKGYFSSNRAEIGGGDDLYEFKISNKKEEPVSSRNTPASKLMVQKKVLKAPDPEYTVYFDYNKTTLGDQGRQDLEELAIYLNSHPGLELNISGHTDSRGSDQYNEKLSFARVMEVRNYLMSKGIPSAQLVLSYFGERLLVNECSDEVFCEEDRHATNRRVFCKPETRSNLAVR